MCFHSNKVKQKTKKKNNVFSINRRSVANFTLPTGNSENCNFCKSGFGNFPRLLQSGFFLVLFQLKLEPS